MKTQFTGRLAWLLAMLALVTLVVQAQVTTSGRLTGVVADANGALIPKAQIVAKHDQTLTEYKTIANEDGGWTIPSIPNGTYTVTISAQGFKTTLAKDVKVDAGQVASLHSALETGGASEQVIVTGGAEVLQKDSTSVATTIVGRQIGELPFSTRDALQLVLTLPGVLTPGTPRTSSLNGLPKGSVNLTLDGANIQDNFLRSSDGFFTSIQAKSDAVQEVTVTTATPGAESGGEGAVQIRFITKSGSPEYHGGAFWQYRSKTFNSNYYFNNIDGLPRDAFILRQWGGNLGGPITIPKVLKGKDKLFFFVNYEYFTLPNAYSSLAVFGNELVLTNAARAGVFTYADSGGVVRTVDLMALAGKGAGGNVYPNTVDPTIAKGLGLIDGYVHQDGALTSRIGTNNDYNRLNYQFQDPGSNVRWFPTIRLDANVTAKHHLEFIHNYQHYFSNPDGVNGQINVYPGSGLIVGHPGVTGSIHRNSFSFVGAHRWTINDRLVNEVRATSSGNGTSLFTQEFAPGLYDFWDGYAPSGGGFLSTNAFRNRTSQSRRNTPVKGLSDNLTMLKSTHTLNLGFAYTRVASFTQAVNQQVVPIITFGLVTNDPVNTGSTSLFTAANFPGSSATQRSDAATMYALLTGRVASITRSATLNGNTRAFEFIPFSEYNHQNEFAVYAQDSWKARQNLTFNYGLRWEFEPSPVNDNLVYTRTGIEGLFGVSGNGKLFQPGVFAGKPTQFSLLQDGEKGYRTRHKDFGPSVGFAWSPNASGGLLGKIVGKGDQTVIRGGYSIAYTREGFASYTDMFGSNNGPTVSLSVSPTICAGAPCSPAFPISAGGVLYRNRPNLPSLTPPADTSAFPLTPGFLSAVSANDFDPNLKAGYTQSMTFGIQRELDKNTVVEARFVSTHGTHLWRQQEYNEVNIFENGFLDTFKAAQNNLLIFAKANPATCVITGTAVLSVTGTCNYGNSGLAGQVAVPLITTAIGGSGAATDSTTVTRLVQGQAGAVANSIAFSAARMNNLMNAGLIPFTTLPNGSKISNFFIVNPQVANGTFVMTNGINTTFNALQIELRRRLANGLLVQGSYQFGKALSNSFTSAQSSASNPRTLRRPDLDKAGSPWDVRHSFKLDWIYELPIGPGKPFLSSNNPIIGRIVGGWQLGGVARVQSGPSILFTSSRLTFNQNDAGVVLHNITNKQLQDMMKIRKTTVCDPNCHGVIYWLPDAIIKNTKAAFDNGGTLDPNAPYIGPPTKPGELGDRLVLYGPMFARFDLNVMKRIRITERTNFEGRVQFLNAFNRANFFVGSIASVNSPLRTIGANATDFGETRAAYRDPTVSGTNDPGGRLIEFQLRLNF